MPFHCVTLDLLPDRTGPGPDAAEAACFGAGALSVTLTDLRDDPVLEPAPGEVRLWPATRLSALFAIDIEPAALLRDLGAALGLEPAAFRLSRVEDRLWEREWLRDFHAMRFGRRLWVAPSHEPVNEPGAVVVALDPGLAFGTGTHPTTALCLEWLDAHPPRGRQVVDYGCGSGILGIAAAKLGAARVLGFDIDAQALLATADNARRNGVAEQVAVAAAAEPLPAGSDLLLANILAQPLVALAPAFARLVRVGGDLVLSGLLEADCGEVTRACAPWFDMASFGSRDGWICLAGVRRVHDLP